MSPTAKGRKREVGIVVIILSGESERQTRCQQAEVVQCLEPEQEGLDRALISFNAVDFDMDEESTRVEMGGWITKRPSSQVGRKPVRTIFGGAKRLGVVTQAVRYRTCTNELGRMSIISTNTFRIEHTKKALSR